RRVPDRKRAPVHARGAGEPRGPYAQPQQEPSEVDGLRSVPLEERLADLQELLALAAEGARALEHPAPALAPDQVADVVAHDRAGGGKRDHELDLELAPAGEDGGGDQGGLTGHRDAAGLAH